MGELIGLDIGHNHIIAKRVASEDGRLYPIDSAHIGLPRGTMDEKGHIVNPEMVTQGLRTLVRDYKLKGKRVNVALGSSALTVQSILRPQEITGEDLTSSVRYEVSAGLPFRDTSNAQIEYALTEYLPGNPPMQRLLAVAVHRKVPSVLIEAVRAAKLIEQAVEPEPLILPRVIDVGRDDGPPEILVAIGKLTSSIIIVRRQKVYFVQTIPFGGDHLTHAIAELGHTPAEAERLKRASSIVGPETNDPRAAERMAMRQHADALANHIYKVMSYSTSEGLGDVRRVVLTGGGALLDGLPGHLSGALGLGVAIGEPVLGLEVDDLKAFPREALAYALALRPDGGKRR